MMKNKIILLLLSGVILIIVIDSFAFSGKKKFYLDPIRGNDIYGEGSYQKPWKTLGKAISVAKKGNIFLLKSGQYGFFRDKRRPGNRTGWITFKAAKGSSPIFKGIIIKYQSPSKSYLRFSGIKIKHSKTGIFLKNTNYTEINNCVIDGTNKYTSRQGVKLLRANHGVFFHNEIKQSFRGIVALMSQNITIGNNHIHKLGGGTGIMYAGDNKKFLIENNYLHDSNWDKNIAPYKSPPHGSGISIRSSDVIIKKNIMHDIGSSSGIMSYTKDAAGGEDAYSNILIENNLLYDIHNPNIIRFYNLGENVVIRNNTLIGKLRDVKTVQYRLNSVLGVHLIAKDYDGAGIKVFNNILAGIVRLPQKAMVTNNIIYSFGYLENPYRFTCNPEKHKNIILVCGSRKPVADLKNNLFIRSPILNPDHNQRLSFKLKKDGIAVNFGHHSKQPNDSLGEIGDDDFIRDNGTKRDRKKHSVGCYEYQ